MYSKLCLLFAICICKISGEPLAFGDAIQKCLVSYNLTYEEMVHWYKSEKFPVGKENSKCVFECTLKALDVVDSNSVPTKEKLSQLTERSINEGHINPNLLILGSDIVVEKCLPPKDMSSPCNIAYEFTLCTKDVKKVIFIEGLVREAQIKNSTDFRSLNFKNAYLKNIVPTMNACERLNILEKELF